MRFWLHWKYYSQRLHSSAQDNLEFVVCTTIWQYSPVFFSSFSLSAFFFVFFTLFVTAHKISILHLFVLTISFFSLLCYIFFTMWPAKNLLYVQNFRTYSIYICIDLIPVEILIHNIFIFLYIYYHRVNIVCTTNLMQIIRLKT